MLDDSALFIDCSNLERPKGLQVSAVYCPGLASKQVGE